MMPESKGGGKGFMTLRQIEPGRALAFEGLSPFGPLRGTWTLVVVPDGPNRTRLLARDRASSDGPAVPALLSREIFEPMHFVMTRRLFLGIKALAVLFASALVFQVLTFAQPSPVVGAILVIALALPLVRSNWTYRLR
jgi:hypothetical protein